MRIQFDKAKVREFKIKGGEIVVTITAKATDVITDLAALTASSSDEFDAIVVIEPVVGPEQEAIDWNASGQAAPPADVEG